MDKQQSTSSIADYSLKGSDNRQVSQNFDLMGNSARELSFLCKTLKGSAVLNLNSETEKGAFCVENIQQHSQSKDSDTFENQDGSV